MALKLVFTDSAENRIVKNGKFFALLSYKLTWILEKKIDFEQYKGF